MRSIKIIYCKDCIHYHKKTGYCDLDNSVLTAGDWHIKNDDDFCSMAEQKMEEDINMKDILDTKFYSSDLDQMISLRCYLKKILSTLWKEGEAFNGKRPFGNSGWQWDIAVGLVKAGLVEGILDEDEYIDECNWKQFDIVVLQAIECLN